MRIAGIWGGARRRRLWWSSTRGNTSVGKKWTGYELQVRPLVGCERKAAADPKTLAAKADFAQDPLASSSAPAPKSKLAASLNFSSSTAANPTQRRLADGEELPSESWEDVIKRSKVEAEVKKLAKEVKERDEKLEKEKKEKAKKKEKKVQAKKQSMLSFGGDE